MGSHVLRSRSKLYSMHQQHQAEISTQIEALLDSICTSPLPIADRLELRRLVDALCHASRVTNNPENISDRVDAAVTALKRFKANLKRRTDARDGLTSKRLMDLPEDARAILLSSIAFIFRDEVDEWSQIDFGNEAHVEMLQVSVAQIDDCLHLQRCLLRLISVFSVGQYVRLVD